MHYCLVAYLVVQLSSWGRESWLLHFSCIWMLCESKSIVSLSHGAMSWSQFVIVEFPSHTLFLHARFEQTVVFWYALSVRP